MKVIGITGGVGAGKSRVLAILQEEYDARLIQADEVAKDLEEPGQPGYEGLLAVFGSSLLAEDQTIDRQRLAELIFHDPQALKQVNDVIHPLTWEAIKAQIDSSDADLIAVEAALFNRQSREICTELWYVAASVENRIRRLMENRGYDREKCLRIMASQPSHEEFLALADRVIDNNKTPADVRRQIKQISERIKL